MKTCLFRLSAFVLSLLLPLFCFALPASAGTEPKNLIAGVAVRANVSARAAILMEETSGTVLFEKAADLRLPMASTTKIMTALVALENASPDLIVSTPKEAVGTEGSSIYLFEGEALTLMDLVWALLLASANDAAVAIAHGVAGGIEPFAALMNQKAAELGLKNTHFVNPHGLDNDEHYTTARDLATIARAALANPTIRKITATKKKTIPHNGTDGVRLLVNHNKLLRMYEGTIGVKTGFTKRSGRCLVSAAERDGLSLIAVTLDAPSDWNDHRNLLDAGFDALSALSLANKAELSFSLPVVGGKAETVTVSNPEAVRVLLPSSHEPVTAVVELPRFLYAPLPAGSQAGRVIWYAGGTAIAEVPLWTEQEIQKLTKPNGWQQFWSRLFHR